MKNNSKLPIKDKYIIVVPINEKGAYELNYPAYGYTENMIIEEFDFKESNFLDASIFSQFNEEFNMLIDFYESESLSKEHYSRAVKIAEEFKNKVRTDWELAALNKVVKCLKTAIEKNAPFIDIAG